MEVHKAKDLHPTELCVTYADYRALEEDRQTWIKTYQDEWVEGDRLREENKRLTVELAECRKDAERYRWLRNENKSFFGEGENFAVVIDDQDGGTWVGSDLDQAIDIAMTVKEPIA